jgi:L-2-hydroxyglutarate oxidase LhgO
VRLRVGVVGGGIIGVSLVRRLLQLLPDAEVTLLEKEPRLGVHQTGHNSGVVHAGIYYQPGSLKARLCRRGVTLLKEFCQERGLTYDECGKLVVALDEQDRARLDDIHARAIANGVPGVRQVGPAEMRQIEPAVTGIAALHSPVTAIVDFAAVTRALADDAQAAGLTVLLGHQVVGIAHRGNEVRAYIRQPGSGRSGPPADIGFDRLVLCAGVESDRLAMLAGDEREPAIVPFRGEYYLLRPERRDLVRGLIYPVPDPRFPFLGVHLTRRHDGEVLVGPNAVLALARDGYRRRDLHLRDVWDTVHWPGFRRFAYNHWRTGARELAGSLWKRVFAAQAARYVPELNTADLVAGPSGIRAQALGRDGALVDDFRISTRGRVTAVRNAPSPAATSSLAIAEHLADLVLGRLSDESAPARPAP